MRILAGTLLLIALSACSPKVEVTLSSEDCETLGEAERQSCMERLASAIDKVSEEVGKAGDEIDRVTVEVQGQVKDVQAEAERMQRAVDAAQAELRRPSEPAPPPAPRP